VLNVNWEMGNVKCSQLNARCKCEVASKLCAKQSFCGTCETDWGNLDWED